MQVKQFNAGLYDANSYLVNGRVLIDTGINTSALLAEIEKNIGIKELELIILTHCHFDHSAAALEIAEKSGARIAIHKDDAALLKDNDANASNAFGYKNFDLEPDMLLEEGEKIPIGSDEILELIHTPGHTPGGICLYESTSKSLFSGDTVFPNGSIGRTDFKGGNRLMITESIKKLVQLDVQTLYPGHGMATSDNVNEQIEQSLKMSRSILL
ncbi:MBL fold metallo-hydrolase [Methanolobus sp. ZRKC3]|uniref:MBL fold metallo-hydrolase n=1 Tax=Methanolobus sp. ZRKC3 TaxID=3125786 RepID=UPI00324547DC